MDKIISLNTAYHSNQGWFRLKLNTDEYKRIMSSIVTDVQKVANDTGVMYELAQAIIDMAEEEDLVPYRAFYQLRKTKKVLDKKTGKEKLIRNYHKRMYHYESGIRVYATETDFDEWDRPESVYDEDKHRMYVKTYGMVPYLRYDRRRRKNGDLIPSTLKSGKKVKSEKLFKPVKSSQIQREGGTPLKFQGMESGQMFADRPPHLIDSYKIIEFSNNVGIQYSVRKDKNDHFSTHNSGKNYADIQYFSEDAGWKRTTPGTTSRWLEVAIGLQVDENIKIPYIANGKKNFEALKTIVRKNIRNTSVGKYLR